MKRIQAMLEVQEKEFEKVSAFKFVADYFLDQDEKAHTAPRILSRLDLCVLEIKHLFN